jgi:hypothetical protein
MGFHEAQELIFVRAARDNTMTARLQNGLDPGACDLVSVGDYERGHFTPRRPSRREHIIDFRGHDFHPTVRLRKGVRALRYGSRRHAGTVAFKHVFDILQRGRRYR